MTDIREQNLKKLEQIFQLLDNSLTREEFVTFAEQLTKRVVSAQKRTDNAASLIEKIASSLPKKVNDDTAKALKSIEKQIAELRTAALAAFDGKMKEVDAKLATVKNGEPGPQGDPGEPGSIKDLSPDEVRDLLELLQGDDRLDVSAIKNLPEKLEQLQRAIQQTGLHIIGNARKHVKIYDLSSSLDGSTTTFQIPGNWAVVGVYTSSTPGVLRPTIDYTYTASTITFTNQITASTTLAAGQTVIVQYEEA